MRETLKTQASNFVLDPRFILKKLYNINANLIKVIESLYSKATSAICYNGSVGEWFRITVGVKQGCLLSPTLFNIFLGRIMTDALEDHEGSVSISSKLTIC